MLKTAGITFGSRLLGAVLSFALVVWISRGLGSEARGVCGFYLVIIALITAVSDIAGGAAIPFLLSKYPGPVLLRGQMAWALIPSLIIPVAFIFFYQITIPEALLLMVAGWLNSTWSVLQQLLIGRKKFHFFNLFTICFPALSIAFFAVLFFLGKREPVSYLISMCASWLVILIIILFFLKLSLLSRGPEKVTVFQREVFKNGLLNQLSHLVSLVNSKLIFFILPAATLGLWANTLTLCEAFLLIPGSFGQVAYGMMASQGDQTAKVKIFRKAWFANLAIAVPAILVMGLLPDAFWTFIFGSDFSGITLLLVKALPGLGIYSFYLLISYLQSASGGFRFNLYCLLLGLGANICLTAILMTTGNYSVTAGIFALVFAWVVASVSGIGLLFRHNRDAFKALYKIQYAD